MALWSSLREIRDAIPRGLFERDIRRGLAYLARDFALASFAVWLIGTTDNILQGPVFRLHPAGVEALRWIAWLS